MNDVEGAAPPERRPHPFLSWFLAPRGSNRADKLRRAVEGKVVLVTGASYGIGEALALRLGAAGATVVLAARTRARLDEVARRISGAGGRAEVLPLDLTAPEQVTQAAEALLRQVGGVDVVIHNAGKSIRRSLENSLDRPQDFERSMAVNYLGPVRLQLALLPSMFTRGRTQIVNVSSVGVRLPAAPRWAAYLASKSAFDTWLRASAPELHHRHVACSSIYLGLVHTRMSAPTPAYRSMPGLTADEAAGVICRAIIRRSRSISPWWLPILSAFAFPLSGIVGRVQGWIFPWGSDSPAARSIERG